jgi:hypothetical protein
MIFDLGLNRTPHCIKTGQIIDHNTVNQLIDHQLQFWHFLGSINSIHNLSHAKKLPEDRPA